MDTTMRKLLSIFFALAVTVGVSASAFGQFLTLGNVGGSSGGGGGGSLTFLWTDSDFVAGTPAPSVTFTAKSIGTASSDRYVVVTLGWRGSNASGMDIPTNGVTIGGVTATRAAYDRSASNAQGVWFAAVPTGTTANIVIGGWTNGFVDAICLNVGTIKGNASLTNPSNVTTPAYPNGSTATAVTVPSNGVSVIASVTANNNTGAPVTSWTGGAVLDKDQTDGPVSFGATGSMSHLTTSGTITMSSANNGGAWGWVAANFQ